MTNYASCLWGGQLKGGASIDLFFLFVCRCPLDIVKTVTVCSAVKLIHSVGVFYISTEKVEFKNCVFKGWQVYINVYLLCSKKGDLQTC